MPCMLPFVTAAAREPNALYAPGFESLGLVLGMLYMPSSHCGFYHAQLHALYALGFY
jgi:hypothetical protein